MDLEDRLSRLKNEIMAIKRDVTEKSAESEPKTMPADAQSLTISYKLDTLIAEYLRVKDKIQSLRAQGRIS
ncbi:MAG: hypothetical protein GX058_07075 [Firmicutes bacterium]|nr:hypothetical protein [Bacillota bacterium]